MKSLILAGILALASVSVAAESVTYPCAATYMNTQGALVKNAPAKITFEDADVIIVAAGNIITSAGSKFQDRLHPKDDVIQRAYSKPGQLIDVRFFDETIYTGVILDNKLVLELACFR